MAGTFAHIILTDTLCHEAALIAKLPKAIQAALKNYAPFAKFGSVGPDCPYAVCSTGATEYANLMHYLRTADFVRYAIPRIYEMNFGTSDARACIAWLFGYCAHLVTDMTFHPVISRKFGAYSASSKNRKTHRLCELNQDVYITKKRRNIEVVGSDFLKLSQFGACAAGGNLHRLNPAIMALWTYVLEQYPRSETKAYVRLPKESLKPNVWYATFVNIFQNVITKGNGFLKHLGLGYPRLAELDPVYIENLPTADGSMIEYDLLFEKAAENVRRTWVELAAALDAGNAALFQLKNGSLDTGLADADGQPIFVV